MKAMRRTLNPSIPQTAALIGLAIVGTLWTTAALAKRKWKKTKARKKYTCAPYMYDEEAVRSAIDLRIREGFQDQSLVASEVAAELFGEYPGGGTIVFPPGPDDPVGAQCVWALVVDLVDLIFTKQNIEATELDEGIAWQIRDRNDPGYPWLQPSLEVDNIPTPGMFVDMGNYEGAWDPSSGYDSLVRTSLANALVMAGKDPALATGSSSTSKRLRREMRALFHCSKFLDNLYGQTDPNKAHGPGETAQRWMVNSQGRGLNWNAVHADNLQRIGQGLAPRRQTDLQGDMPADMAGHPMLMWVPAVDLNALGGAIPTVKASEWSDGSSTTEPPPVVQNLGLDMGGVEMPGGAGC